jgi:predicted metal-binding protein
MTWRQRLKWLALEFVHAWFPEEWFYEHLFCPTCKECMVCNLRPCRDGGAHGARNTKQTQTAA